jgi:hypothetical protein
VAKSAPADGETALAAYAAALADAIDAALPRWVERCVARFVPLDGAIEASTRAAGEGARRDIGTRTRALLATDVDEQQANPLMLLRAAVSYPTEVLRAAGVAPVARDEFEVRQFPDDAYGLTPASFAEVDPALHEPGIVWGAAKAYVLKQRRRREGRV